MHGSGHAEQRVRAMHPLLREGVAHGLRRNHWVRRTVDFGSGHGIMCQVFVVHIAHVDGAVFRACTYNAALQERLSRFAVTISRREIRSLFDAYCTLLRASQSLADDHVWRQKVRANGGIIVSIDGIQPDKGSETIYLVRDTLTGRLLAAENVRSSDTPTVTALLRPIRALGLPVVGAISDAQASLLQAIATLWPAMPHQVCQLHYLREASRPMFDGDRTLRKQIRKAIQQDVRAVRRQIDA